MKWFEAHLNNPMDWHTFIPNSHSGLLRVMLNIGVGLCIILLAGCYPSSGINTYTQNRGIAKFTFDYQGQYKKEVSDIVEGLTSIVFGRNYTDLDTFGRFGVFVFSPGILGETADDYLSREQSHASSYEDYELVGISDVTMEGILAKQLVYSYQRGKSTDFPAPKNPAKALHTEVIFDFNGLTWSIWMDSPMVTYETDKNDFEYILNTFNIHN